MFGLCSLSTGVADWTADSSDDKVERNQENVYRLSFVFCLVMVDHPLFSKHRVNNLTFLLSSRTYSDDDDDDDNNNNNNDNDIDRLSTVADMIH